MTHETNHASNHLLTCMNGRLPLIAIKLMALHFDLSYRDLHNIRLVVCSYATVCGWSYLRNNNFLICCGDKLGRAHELECHSLHISYADSVCRSEQHKCHLSKKWDL